MKVGDYVRTKSYGIKKINCFSSTLEEDFIDCDYGEITRVLINKKDVIKSNPDIMELLEVGDYINGKKIIKIWEEPFGEFAGQIFTILEGEETAPTIRDIKSIVTKEMFANAEYRVEID